MDIDVSRLDDLESTLESFDAAWSTEGETDLFQFLPPAEDRNYLEILVELVRSDIEFRWHTANRRRLNDYRELDSVFVENKNSLSAVAFEEYRLRWSVGEQVDPDEYTQQYGIDTTDWPIWSASNSSGSSVELKVNAEGLSRESTDCIAGKFPKLGERFVDFEIVGKLGEGAFGKVFLARQCDLANRLVALKVSVSESDEPQHLAQLQHTNIMPVYSLHRVGPLQAVCMPFLGLATLDDVLKGLKDQHDFAGGQQLISTVAAARFASVKDSMTKRKDSQHSWIENRNNDQAARFEQLKDFGRVETALWIVSRIADGLAHAHRQGIVHSDLKPANILLGDNGQPLVLDFHLAQSRRFTGSTQLIGGTLPYMAAEHLRMLNGTGSCDHRSDIFSLGVILFELLTGTLPMPTRDGEFNSTVSRMIKDRGQLPDFRKHSSTNIPTVRSILERCLHHDPDQRYQSADNLHEDIERHLANLPLAHAPNPSVRERIVKWGKRHPRVASTGSALMVTGLLIGLLVFGLAARDRQLDRLNARQWNSETITRLQQTGPAFSAIDLDGQTIDALQEQAIELLEQEQLANWSKFSTARKFRLLSSDDQQRLRSETGQLHYLLTNSIYESAVKENDSDSRREKVTDALQHNEQAELWFGVVNLHATLLQRAQILQLQGHQQAADELRAQAESAQATGNLDRFLMALQHRLEHDEFAARELLEQYVAENHADYKGWLLLGHSHAALQQYDKAEASYSICISLEQNLPWAYLQRGELNLRRKQFKQALADYDFVLKLRPDDRTALANRGLVYQKLKEWDKAEHDLTAVIEQGTSQTRIYFSRANVRVMLGDDEGSAADVEMGMKLAPSDELSWIVRGAAKIKKDPAAALADFDAALKINPSSRIAQNNRAAVLSEFLNRNDEAIESLTTLIAFHPNDASSIASRGVLLARVGERKKAHEDAAFALDLKQNADTMYRVAGIYALTSQENESDKDEAIRLLAKAFWQDPELVANSIFNDVDLKPLHEFRSFRAIASMLNEIRRLGNPTSESVLKH